MIALLVSLAWAQPEPEPATHVTAGVVLRVDDRAAARDAVVDAAEAAGGWFSRLSDEAVTVRIPVGDVDPFLEALPRLGDPIERGYAREDLLARIREAEAALGAREEVLERYMDVLATASPKAVVAVEREITRVVAEIEKLRGQLRVLRDRAAFAEVTVSFRFRDRQAPSRDGSSSFAWLNTMNVADVLADFQSGRRATRSRAKAVAPEGFAPYRHRCRFQAVSPDDLVYRVRSAKNRPRADLPFWREALRTRMVEAGYHVLAEEDVTAADGTPGALLELGAAHGDRDQTYLIGLFVDGGWLVIAEATGEAETFRARRAAVVEAVRRVEP